MNPVVDSQSNADTNSASNGTVESPKPVKPTFAERLEQVKKTCNSFEHALIARVVSPESIYTTFSDVHAPPATIEAFQTLRLSILRPEAFTYGVLARTNLTGVLLYGLPGTGRKTLFVEAFAKQCEHAVLEICSSDIYHKYIREDEKSARAVFTLARKQHSCVVFIDEADAVFWSRLGGGDHRNPWYRNTTNEFLREWDGLSSNDGKQPVIIAATSRPFDIDDAVLRRLPLRILVDVPEATDREAILRIHLKTSS